MPIYTPIIAIDEAGMLADPEDEFVIAAALISAQDDKTFDRILKRERQRLKAAKRGKKFAPEIKFHNSSDTIRRRVLSQINKVEVEIEVFVLEKQKLAVPDSPENYARFIWGVLANCLRRYPAAPILLDSHFNLAQRRIALEETLQRQAGRALKIEHGDSQLHSRLGLVDFVAGAMLRELKGDAQFAEIVRGKIVSLEKARWAK